MTFDPTGAPAAGSPGGTLAGGGLPDEGTGLGGVPRGVSDRLRAAVKAIREARAEREGGAPAVGRARAGRAGARDDAPGALAAPEGDAAGALPAETESAGDDSPGTAPAGISSLPAALESAALAALWPEHASGSGDLDDGPGPGAPDGESGTGARHVGIVAAPAPDPTEVARAAHLALLYDEYRAYLRARIGPLWEFPKARALLGEEGTVRVAFVIHRDGSVGDIRVTRRSGFADFDANVVAAVRRAGPFRPPPPELARATLRFDVPFDFDNPVVLFR